MPNGGVPKQMILYPKESPDTVLYCNGGELRIFDRAEWDQQKSAGQPRLVLSAAEGAAVGWFLRYWIGERALQPGYSMPRDLVHAEFDF